jgi:Fur family ferric uptake transcriptional regulator
VDTNHHTRLLELMSDAFPLGKVDVASTPMERFEEYLQSRSKRVTQQRRTLVDVIFGRHQHFDADELLAELSRSTGSGRVSRPTVYRTLSELVDAGLLRKMDLGGRAVYEHDYGYPQHDHLYCTHCHELYEFRSDELLELRDAVAREHRFRVAGHRLIITGVCERCQRTLRRPKRRIPVI